MLGSPKKTNFWGICTKASLLLENVILWGEKPGPAYIRQEYILGLAMEVSIDGERTRCHFLYQKLKEILTRYNRTILEALKDWLIFKI